MDLPQLRDILVTYFSDGELRDLCFDLGIDYEKFAGRRQSRQGARVGGLLPTA